MMSDLIISIDEFSAAIDGPISLQSVPEPSPSRSNSLQKFGPDNPYFGLGLAEASMRYIGSKGKPQLPSDIWAALKDAGYENAHRNPVDAIRSVLGRRSKKFGDVLLVGGGKWDLVSNYTQVEIERISRELGGMPAREAVTHSKKTSEGMRMAARRGVKLGPKPIITEEMATKLKQLIAGGLSLRAIGKAVGVSHTTVEDWKKRIECWEPGQQWPPQDRSTSAASTTQPDNVTQFRAVK